MKSFKQWLNEAPITNEINKSSLDPYVIEITKPENYERVTKKEPFSTLKGYHLYKSMNGIHIVDPKRKRITGFIGLHRQRDKQYQETMTFTHPKNKIKVHDIYHHLATEHGYEIHGHDHSVGMRKVWEKLSKKPGVETYAQHPETSSIKVKQDKFQDYYNQNKVPADYSVVVRKKKE